MNQQSQNFGQGNAGGNTNIAGLYQYLQQQQSQQHQNHAIAMHPHAQSSFNRNQQNFSQQQTERVVNNVNGMHGITSAQINQLQAMQNQLNSNLARQQQFLNMNQQSHQQLSIQRSSNMNQQQQTQQATNPAGNINELFSQLQSIDNELDNLSFPNITTAANQQSQRPVSINTMGQPSQRPLNPHGANIRMGVDTLIQQSLQSVPGNTMVQKSQRPVPGNTMVQPLQPRRSSPPTIANNTVSTNAQASLPVNITVAMVQQSQQPVVNPQPRRSSPPTTANNTVSTNAQASLPVNTGRKSLVRLKKLVQQSQQPEPASTMGQPSQQSVSPNTAQPSQRQTSSVPTHMNVNARRLSATEILQQHRQNQLGENSTDTQVSLPVNTTGRKSPQPVPVDTMVQPQRPKPANTMGQPSQQPMPENRTQPSQRPTCSVPTHMNVNARGPYTEVLQRHRQNPLGTVPPPPPVQQTQTQQVHRSNPPGNATATTTTTMNRAENLRPNINGQTNRPGNRTATATTAISRAENPRPNMNGQANRAGDAAAAAASISRAENPRLNINGQANRPGNATAATTTTINRAENQRPNINGQANRAGDAAAAAASMRPNTNGQATPPGNATATKTTATMNRAKNPRTNINGHSTVPAKRMLQAANRQDPNMITSIRIISYKMVDVVRFIPPELGEAYMKLHPAQKFALENTLVFKFENRAKQASETAENTLQASFFLDKLQKAPLLVDRKLHLLGLKCKICNDATGYVDGCTSFIDIDNPRTLGLFSHVLQLRRHHLLKCPNCLEINKAIVGAHVPTAQDMQNLVSFSEKWLLVVKAAHFKNVPQNALRAPPRPPTKRTQVAEFLPITEDSIYEELVSAVEMGKATGDLRLDDLTVEVDRLLSPVMEILLTNLRLQSNKQTGIELCWKHPSAENTGKLLVWSFEKQFSVDDDFCKRIWDFFRQQCKECYELPKGIRKLVSSSTELPIEELKFVGKKWSAYASRIFQNQKGIMPKEDVKILRPAYLATPLEYLPGKKSGTFPLQGNFDDNDVVMIGAYRDSIGNCRFRKTVSQFRALYWNLPSNKQCLVVEQTISLIKRRGGSFYSKNGFLAQFDESFSFTQKALERGFPEMMHPVIPAEAKSVVSDVEFARMVDILPDREESMNRATRMMIESLSKSQTASPKPDVRKPPPSRQGQSSAKKLDNGETGKSSVREGQPIDISALRNSSLLNTGIDDSNKRKQDQISAGEASKRHRKST